MKPTTVGVSVVGDAEGAMVAGEEEATILVGAVLGATVVGTDEGDPLEGAVVLGALKEG